MSIHSGHRKRVKEKFINDGLKNFNEHEILELLLFYCIPRCDTNEIAHRLIDRFGSLIQVIQAPARELEKVEGVGKSVSAYLSLLIETNRYLNICKAKECDVLQSIDEYGAYLRNFFLGMHNEVVYLLCMDAKGTVLDCKLVSEGSINSANISIRKILDVVISCNATSVVLAHNHPGGLALPSPDDVLTTKRLAKALYMADVALLDHIIVAGQDYISLYLSRYFDPNDISFDE